jgi:hypothetical protein
MKLGWLILLGAFALLGAGYYASNWLTKPADAAGCDACAVASQKTPDALAWMRRNYSLSEEEFSKVCALHDSYLPKCDQMCQRMAAATKHLSEALKVSPTMTDEAKAALDEYERAQAMCQQATLQHLLDTAATMKPDAGRAFVQDVLPHLLASRRHVSDLQHTTAHP